MLKVRRLVFYLLILSSVACSTSLQVAGPRLPPGHEYRSAHVITHSSSDSADVEASIQRNLLKRGLIVTAGLEASVPAGVDLIVRYADSWSWDVSMYLKSLDLLLYDGHTQSLLASAEWKNSAFHGFQRADAVVARMLTELSQKIGLTALAPKH